VLGSIINKVIKIKLFMKRKYKGGIKIILLLTITIILIVGSAIFFGYGGQQVQDAKDGVQDKAQEVIEEKSAEVVTNAIESGQEVIGKTLKETGEKMLEKTSEPGFYGFYGDDGVDDYAQTILFFTADWCPSCVNVDEEIQKDKKQIPTDVAIVKVDFDDDEGLRETYNVDKQHTFILIGVDGKEIKRWQNSKTLNEIIDNIN
jgi:thiol-disulfide isomerase/thioredoxin